MPPELTAAKVEVRQRLGAGSIDIAIASETVVARHKVAEPGLGVTIRDTGHVTALEAIAMASAPPGRPHRRKERIPPGAAALRAAQVLGTSLIRVHEQVRAQAVPRSSVRIRWGVMWRWRRAQRGYEGTSMTRVTVRVGASKGPCMRASGLLELLTAARGVQP